MMEKYNKTKKGRKMRLSFTKVMVILCWLLISQPVFAENYFGVQNLGEVVVSGKIDGVEKVAVVREVGAEEIERRGARTLDEALELLPGLNIRTGGQSVPRIDIRGMRTRHTKILLDGIPLNATYDGQFNPTLIPVENIEKIKVSYGGSSVLYGQGALAGVINIITKSGEQGIHGSWQQEIAEDVSYDSRFTLSGATEKTDFFLSGNHYKSDGFQLSDDFDETSEENGGLRENSDNRNKDLFGRFTYSPTEKMWFGLTFGVTDADYGVPPNTINDKNDPFSKTVKYERVNDLDNYMVQLSGGYDLDGPLEFRAWAFYNRLNEDLKRSDDDRYVTQTDKGTYSERAHTTVTGLNFQTLYDLEKFGQITFSVSGEKDKYDASGKIMGKSGWEDIDNDNDLELYSLAAEYEVSPFERLTLTLGYGHHWIKKDYGNDDNGASFLVGFNYSLFKDTQVFGSVSRKVRFPSLRQLYDEQNGNPDLDTESSYNYELGIEQQLLLNSTVSLTGFVSDADDFIEKDDFTDIYVNKGEYRFRGVELYLKTQPWKRLFLSAGWTYMDSDQMSNNNGLDVAEHRPQQKLTFDGSYIFDFGLTATVTVLHVNRQYHFSKKQDQRKKLNEYTLVNLKISQDIKKHLVVYGGVDNIFDKDYEMSYGLPRQGQFVYGGFKVKF
jgi:vitamin B12 transporter